MRERLIAARLWDGEDPDDPCASVSAACRYSGLSQDGQREYLLCDPRTGRLLGSGRGRSTPEALCRAALATEKEARTTWGPIDRDGSS